MYQPPYVPASPPAALVLPSVTPPQPACEKCARFKACRTPFMPGYGDLNARVAIVSEYPGSREDIVGRPWVGESSLVFDQLLARGGLRRDEVFLTNAIRCFSVQEATKAQINACSSLLFKELGKMPNLDLIILMGSAATDGFSGDGSVNKLRGTFIKWRNRLVFRTYNPADVARNKQYEMRAFKDWELIRRWRTGQLMEDPGQRKVILIKTVDQLRIILEDIKRSGAVSAHDTETNTLAPWRKPREGSAKILCFSFSYQKGIGYVLPWAHRQAWWTQDEQRQIHALLKAFYEDPTIPKVWQNEKFDRTQIRMCMGISIEGTVGDTHTAHHALDSDRYGHGLEHIAWEHTTMGGYHLEFDSKVEELENSITDFNYEDFDLKDLTQYAGEDPDATLRAWLKMAPQLESEGAMWGFRNLTLPLSKTLSHMEENGLAVDTRYLEKLGAYIAAKKQDIEARMFSLPKVREYVELLKKRDPKAADKKLEKGERIFNVGSPDQLNDFLFKFCQLDPPGRRGKKGYSTNIEALEALAPQSALCRWLIQWRKAETYQKTFVTPMPDHLYDLMGAPDWIKVVHTSFFIAGTETFRLSSANPNMQNQPRDDDEVAQLLGIPPVKGLFISRWYEPDKHWTNNPDLFENPEVPGKLKKWKELLSAEDHVLNMQGINRDTLKAEVKRLSGYKHVTLEDINQDRGLLAEIDLSQIEVRVMAQFSQDPALLEIFKQGGDVHRQTAAKAYHKKPEDVTDRERFKAKRIVFGLNYGGGPEKLAELAECSVDEAIEFIRLYFQAFPGIQTWMDQQKKLTRQHKRCWTGFGFFRWILDIDAKKDKDRSEAERKCINTPVQGTAAGVNAIAINSLTEAFIRLNFKSLVCCTVHDSLILDIYPGEYHKVAKVIKAVYGNLNKVIPWMQVPILYDAKVGPRWSEMKEWDLKNVA